MRHAIYKLSAGTILNLSAAEEIRALLSKGVKSNVIAKNLGVTHSTISHIKTGKTWKG